MTEHVRHRPNSIWDDSWVVDAPEKAPTPDKTRHLRPRTAAAKFAATLGLLPEAMPADAPKSPEVEE